MILWVHYFLGQIVQAERLSGVGKRIWLTSNSES